MNRRSVLRWPGFAPVATPAAVAAASAAALSPIDYSALAADVRDRADAALAFDGRTRTIPSLRATQQATRPGASYRIG